MDVGVITNFVTIGHRLLPKVGVSFKLGADNKKYSLNIISQY